MSRVSKQLQAIAEQEMRDTLAALPGELRQQSQAVTVVYDGRSYEQLEREGAGDLLGLFVGENMLESGHSGGLPPQIILYLDNLWWEAEEDEGTFRREVRTTLLHELGHYLGLEEIDLEERGL
jgi:predicted Zn-dependent protease with MMP-like domain